MSNKRNAAAASSISGIDNKANLNAEDYNTLMRRVERAMEQWYEMDNEAINLLEKIAHLAKNNRSLYDTAKQMLLKT